MWGVRGCGVCIGVAPALCLPVRPPSHPLERSALGVVVRGGTQGATPARGGTDRARTEGGHNLTGPPLVQRGRLFPWPPHLSPRFHAGPG